MVNEAPTGNFLGPYVLQRILRLVLVLCGRRKRSGRSLGLQLMELSGLGSLLVDCVELHNHNIHIEDLWRCVLAFSFSKTSMKS